MIFLVIATIEGREHQLENLLSSLPSYFSNHALYTIVVRQYRNTRLSTLNCDFLHQTKTYGASKARNLGLKEVFKLAENTDFVCFPDDDCHFISQPCTDSLNHDFIFGDILADNYGIRMGAKVPQSISSLSRIYPYVNCPSFMVRINICQNHFFDEEFGPGSTVPACEETEYLYRLACRSDVICKYDSNFRYGHPYEFLAGDKMRSYALSQGLLLRRIIRNNKFAFPYIVSCSRPLGGMVLSLLKFNFRLTFFYIKRLFFIVSGFSRDY